MEVGRTLRTGNPAREGKIFNVRYEGLEVRSERAPGVARQRFITPHGEVIFGRILSEKVAAAHPAAGWGLSGRMATAPRFGSPAPKLYREGTARMRPPAETLALLRPLMGRFGVTRLANVTGLDRLGIPVWQAIRPNARALSVSQGKGLDAPSAQVSALMESLESHHAEHARCAVRLESQRALARQACVADPTRLPLSRSGSFHPDAALPWTPGRDVATGEPVFVPFELVHANYTLPRVPGSGAFAPSTSGLGAGNHLAEAVLRSG